MTVGQILAFPSYPIAMDEEVETRPEDAAYLIQSKWSPDAYGKKRFELPG